MQVSIPDSWVPSGYRLTGKMVDCFDEKDKSIFVLCAKQQVKRAASLFGLYPEVEPTREAIGVAMMFDGKPRKLQYGDIYLHHNVVLKWTTLMPSDNEYQVISKPTVIYRDK